MWGEGSVGLGLRGGWCSELSLHTQAAGCGAGLPGHCLVFPVLCVMAFVPRGQVTETDVSEV